MRHRVYGYKLGRNTPHRKSLIRNLAAGLFQHGQITTTLQKAKAVQPFVEKLITMAKKGDLHSRRRAIAKLQDRRLIKVIKGGESEEVDEKTLIQKLFDEIGPRYAERTGGYTRIVRLPKHRIGDGSDLVISQLVDEDADGGPGVKGGFSRRRQMQDKRMVFAAERRRMLREGDVDENEVEAETTDEDVEEIEEEAAEVDATADEEKEKEE